jgi:predicted GTPase
VLDKEKIVVCINKADLFYPGDWDERLHAPGAKMAETLAERIGVLSEALDLRGSQQVVAISALRDWNLYALIASLVEAAGQSRAPKLLRALSKMAQTSESRTAETDLGARFGIKEAMRSRFRRVLDKAQKKQH